MTRVLLADHLTVRTTKISEGLWMGVEFSRPVAMIGADAVTVTGVVHDVNRTANDHCQLEVQGSNDLTTWFTVSSTWLPTSPGPITVPSQAVRATGGTS